MSGDVPFLCVAVPTRNRAPLLRDCLASLVNQNFPAHRYEIIVVDDGSTDGTAAVVRQFQAVNQSPTVRYVLPEGRGLNAARNAGLQAARGDPIAFVDDDIEAPPSWLRAVVDGVDRHPEAHCLGGAIRLRLEGKPPWLCGRERLGETELDLGQEEKPVGAVWGANMCLRRSALALVGPFNEALSGSGDEEEWELRLLAAGGRIVYLPGAWLWHRRSARQLRLFHLMRSRFRRGVEQTAFETLVGRRRVVARQELGRTPRFVGHALLRRCAGGLLAATASAGRAWGVVALRALPRFEGVRRLLARPAPPWTYPPMVTVVIPTRNRLLLLREAVASVVAQTFSRWELVVVDDASVDGTSAWLAGMGDPRMRAVRFEQHAERSAARNRGLAEARGEYVLFLDDDERLPPSALEALRRALLRHPDAVAAVGARLWFGAGGDRWRSPHPRLRSIRSVWHDVIAGWGPSGGQSLFRTDAVRSCGAYDPALTVAEDHDLWLRLVGLGPVVLLPTTVLEYRIHTGQQPRDEEEAGDRVRRSWAAKLPPAERGEVLRILEARTLIRSGVLAIRRGEYAAALRDYVRGARHAPELVRSSLSRSAVLHGVLKAVLGVIGGHHLVSAATRLASAVRRPLSRSRS